MHSFLHDAKGKPSHTRLLVMLSVPLLVILPLLIWAFVSLRAGALAEIPLTITGYLGAANGIILGYAVHNKREETKAATTP
jgi:hypothetical protein